LTPGLFLLHDGQAEGRRFRLPVQLGVQPHEARDAAAEGLYERILEAARRPEVRQGQWELLHPISAWEGNPTWERYVAFRWGGEPGEELLCVANLQPNAGQCFVRLPAAVYQGETWILRDLLGPNILRAFGRRDGQLRTVPRHARVGRSRFCGGKSPRLAAAWRKCRVFDCGNPLE